MTTHNDTDKAARYTLFLRLMAGSVFFWEGLLKLVYVNQGVGRFTKLGFPFPELTAHAVAGFEIVGGLLIMAGLFTRLVALGFVIEMVVAILSTKISLFLGTSPLALPASPPKVGIWAVLHEVRSEWAQLTTSLFLVLAGPGPWSVDARRARRVPTRGARDPHASPSTGLATKTATEAARPAGGVGQSA
jgi:putative oxidoreductase